jgi:hypothetical protein
MQFFFQSECDVSGLRRQLHPELGGPAYLEWPRHSKYTWTIEYVANNAGNKKTRYRNSRCRAFHSVWFDQGYRLPW